MTLNDFIPEIAAQHTMEQSFWTQFSLRTPLQSSTAASNALINDLRGPGLAESQWENFLEIIQVHHPSFSNEKTNTWECGCLLSLNSCVQTPCIFYIQNRILIT